MRKVVPLGIKKKYNSRKFNLQNHECRFNINERQTSNENETKQENYKDNDEKKN